MEHPGGVDVLGHAPKHCVCNHRCGLPDPARSHPQPRGGGKAKAAPPRPQQCALQEAYPELRAAWLPPLLERLGHPARISGPATPQPHPGTPELARRLKCDRDLSTSEVLSRARVFEMRLIPKRAAYPQPDLFHNIR